MQDTAPALYCPPAVLIGLVCRAHSSIKLWASEQLAAGSHTRPRSCVTGDNTGQTFSLPLPFGPWAQPAVITGCEQGIKSCTLLLGRRRFTYRYLVFGPDREELVSNIEGFLKKVYGK